MSILDGYTFQHIQIYKIHVKLEDDILKCTTNIRFNKLKEAVCGLLNEIERDTRQSIARTYQYAVNWEHQKLLQDVKNPAGDSQLSNMALDLFTVASTDALFRETLSVFLGFTVFRGRDAI